MSKPASSPLFRTEDAVEHAQTPLEVAGPSASKWAIYSLTNTAVFTSKTIFEGCSNVLWIKQ